MALGKVCPPQDGTIKTWAFCVHKCRQCSMYSNTFSIGVQHGRTMVAWVCWLLLHEIWMNCCFWNSMGQHLFYKQDLETPNDISTFT